MTCTNQTLNTMFMLCSALVACAVQSIAVTGYQQQAGVLPQSGGYGVKPGKLELSSTWFANSFAIGYLFRIYQYIHFHQLTLRSFIALV